MTDKEYRLYKYEKEKLEREDSRKANEGMTCYEQASKAVPFDLETRYEGSVLQYRGRD